MTEGERQGSQALYASCPACGAAAAVGARFCRTCGARLPETCLNCHAVLGANAQFCRSCGEAVAAAPLRKAPKPKTPPRRAIPRWVALPGVAIIIVVLAGFAWVLFLRGDGTRDDGRQVDGDTLESSATILEPPAEGAVDGVNGLPLRGRIRLDHPAGATADIPGGSSLYGEVMDLRRVPLAENPWWDHGGFGWEFVSFVGVPIAGEATVDLPATVTGAKVIVRTSSGLWLELPTQGVTLKDGRAGFRVTVSGVPAPWTFALATPKTGAPLLSAEEQDALRLETVYWTDRLAWEQEMLAWLKTDPLARTVTDGRLASQVPGGDPSREFDKIRAQLRFTLKILEAARLGAAPEIAIGTALPGIPGLELTAQGLWAGGVDRLVVVKANWLAFRATLDIANAQANYQVAIYFVDQWIETTMHNYTPWGIDFVKALLDAGQLKDLDIRVLKPYGELKWADITLAADEVPEEIEAFAQDEFARGKNPIANGAKVQRTLRLYSVRAMERLTIVDWLKDNVDWVVRWLPVALAGAGLIPGTAGLSLAFALADQILNWVNDWYTAAGEHPYAYMVMEGVSAGGISGTSFVMDMAEERVLMQQAGRAMLPSHGLTIAQFAYSVGMFMAINQTDYYTFKTIREAAADTRGYCVDGRCDSISGGIPPVMLHIRGAGYLSQPAGTYPTNVDRLMAFRLKTTGFDFHETWLQGGRSYGQPVQSLSFEQYGYSNWPTVLSRTQPQYQALRLAIPKSVIPPEAWGARPNDAPLSEFGLELALTGPNGEAATIKLTEDAAKLATDRADTFYSNVLLRAPGERELSTEELRWFEDGLDPGPGQQAAFADSAALVLNLAGSLHFADSRIEPVPVTITFDEAPARVVMASGGDDLLPGNKVARVHFGTASAASEIDGIYEIVKWQMTGGSGEITPSYFAGELQAIGTGCETAGACTFAVNWPQAGSSDPGHQWASVCGPEKNGSRICSGVAETTPYKPPAGSLPPTSNDNFFQISGPILTGSAVWRSYGNPGEPVTIGSWNEIRAEFKDGKVTATITANRRLFDTVNAVITNVRVASLTIEFEAVKTK